MTRDDSGGNSGIDEVINDAGTLYVVATPLGNLDDLSPRAVETLRAVTLIACEDTRRTSKLLVRHGIRKERVSCHKFNEKARLDPILERLRRSESVALVSDGGTPGVADPGALLVRAALDEGISVVAIPGPSAVAALLSASGLPADRYVFDGFLPHRAGERRRRLRALADESRTVVVFESPQRIRDTLADIDGLLPERSLVLGRELTKLHETILRGTAAELLEKLGDPVRGEITLALAGTAPGRAEIVDREGREILSRWRESLQAAAGDRRRALRQAARSLGMRRAELQRRLAELDPEA